MRPGEKIGYRESIDRLSKDIIMNSSIGGPDPTHFAARLGTLAASMHTAPPQADTSRPMPISPRLAEVLASLRRRHEAFETFKANHFIMAD